MFVGLIDDFNALSPLQKLFGQIIAVACFLKGGFALKSRFFSDYINIAASGFWMISVINAFNLVDVMDGLATLLALVAALSFFIIAILLQQYTLSLLLIILIGALVAFLFYNRPPAKIYLGDAGSLFIGGFIAAMPLLFRWTKVLNSSSALPSFAQGSLFFETVVSALVPILIVGIPIIEVASLIIIRKYKGLEFYSASPHHFSSYLLKKKWSIQKILFFTGCAASLLSALAILFMFGMLSFNFLLFGIGLFFFCWLWAIFL